MREELKKLAEVAQESTTMPDDVAAAVNDVLAAADKVPWYKAPFFKNGEFSKTAMFATLANVAVLAAYCLSMARGLEITTSFLFQGQWAVPEFDAQAAFAVLGLANGTYIINHMKRTPQTGPGANGAG